MEWLEMRPALTRFLSGVTVCLVLGLVLTPMPPARGQDAGRSPWRGHLALASRGHPGLALAGYGAALASPIGQEDSKRDPSRSGTGEDPAAKEQGQDALATAGRAPKRGSFAFGDPVLQESPALSSGPVPPGVTVEHRGRLLVLTYGSKSTGGGLMSNVNPQDEPPGFVVWQGQRPIASGKFEYG